MLMPHDLIALNCPPKRGNSRGDQRPGSDLDILVTFQSPISLIKIIELENFLTDRLGVRVDLVMRDALKPYIGKQILKEIVAV